MHTRIEFNTQYGKQASIEVNCHMMCAKTFRLGKRYDGYGLLRTEEYVAVAMARIALKVSTANLYFGHCFTQHISPGTRPERDNPTPFPV